jgi:O-antigen ligase
MVVIAAMVLSLTGAVATFTRAGLIGLVAGFFVYVLLGGSKVITVRRFVIGGGIALAVSAAVLLPVVEQTTWFQQGFLRHGNLQVRESYWALAKPVVTDSTAHLLVGHGVNSLSRENLGASRAIGTGLNVTPTLTTIGPHSQYVRIALEQGVLGVALVLIWMLSSPIRAVFARARLPEAERPFVAALSGATICFMAAAAANDTLRHPPSVAAVAVVTGLLVTLTVTGGTRNDAVRPQEDGA